MSPRIVVAAIVGLVHLALVAALLTLTLRSRGSALAEFVTTTLFFAPPEDMPPPQNPLPPPEAASAARTRVTAPMPLATRPAGAPPELPAPASTAITVHDWYDSAKSAAQAEVLAGEDRARRAASMGRAAIDARSLAEAPEKRGPEFTWSKAHTQRIERTEDGATILRLTERCVLVNFVLPFCHLAKEKPRGDLFDGMKEPPEMGDWKD